MQTKAALDQLTKGVLVDKVLKLQDEVLTLSAEPLTGSQIVKKQLALVAQANEVDVEIERIKAETEAKIAKINKEAELEMAVKLEDLLTEYKSLQEKIKDVKSAMKSSIEESEAEAKEKLANIAVELAEAEEAANAKIENLNQKVVDAQATAVKNLGDTKQKQERDLEDLEFEHERAFKQKNSAYAEKLAKELGMELVPSAELKALKDAKPTEEAEIEAKIKDATDKVSSSLHAKYNSEIKDLKHTAEIEKTQLQGKVDNLTAQLAALEAREKSLSSQVEKIPSVIKDAVAAAKAEVNVTNEGAGKK